MSVNGLDLDRIERLLEGATRRPWDVLGGGGDPGPHQRYVALAASDDLVDRSGEPPFTAACVTEGFDSLGSPDLREQDAELIVALVNAAPALIAAARDAPEKVLRDAALLLDDPSSTPDVETVVQAVGWLRARADLLTSEREPTP